MARPPRQYAADGDIVALGGFHRVSDVRNISSENGAIGWLLVGVVLGVALVIFVIVQLIQAIF
jgi:hypothetical protein